MPIGQNQIKSKLEVSSPEPESGKVNKRHNQIPKIIYLNSAVHKTRVMGNSRE